MKELTTEKFDKKLKDNINLNGGLCMCGIGGVGIIIKDGLCGTGVYAECPFCGTRTKRYSISTYIACKDGRLATPITKESLLKGIMNAVKEYNGK